MDQISCVINFAVKQKIGEGGMGEVYLAEDNLSRKVALKVLSPKLSNNEELIKRFIQEAKILASCNHPGVVTLYSFFEVRGLYFIAMEFAEGVTLKQKIINKQLDYDQVLSILQQVLQTLAYTHDKNFVHRDIKPSNIMVSENNEIKVMDFGIAKMIGNRELTSTNAKMGTLFYMSPEQVLEAKSIDHRTDIYSLGVVLFEMLTGRLPFDTVGKSDFEIMQSIHNSNFSDIRMINPNVEPKIATVVKRMLARDLNQRFDSCHQILEELSLASPSQRKRSKIQIIDNFSDKFILVEGNEKIKDFYISRYQYTYGEFLQFAQINNIKPPAMELLNYKSDFPMSSISYEQALYLAKEIGCRLPSTEEWRWAAKGGLYSKNYMFAGSDNYREVAWCNGNSSPNSVGKLKPNELGLFDMSGNIWEFVKDADICGGSFYSKPEDCKLLYSAKSFGMQRSSPVVGFRLVRDL